MSKKELKSRWTVLEKKITERHIGRTIDNAQK
jgi:hypothetical protein